MKTQHLYFATLAILFASCAKQEAEMSPVQSDNELRTFVADFEQTKTNLAPDGEGVYRKMIWSAGDKVGIFDASGVPQPFETKTGGASATFTGSATAPSGSWYAFYPYNAKATKEKKETVLVTKRKIRKMSLRVTSLTDRLVILPLSNEERQKSIDL